MIFDGVIRRLISEEVDNENTIYFNQEGAEKSKCEGGLRPG